MGQKTESSHSFLGLGAPDGGVRLGKIVRVTEKGGVFVDCPGNGRGPMEARYVNGLTSSELARAAMDGREALLAFATDSPDTPIIIALLHSILHDMMNNHRSDAGTQKEKDVEVDGERIAIDAKKEIVLRCGKSSLTLTRAGKVLIRGEYLLNHATGANRIRGGSVQIN